MQAQGLPLLFELGGDDVAIVARRLSKALGRPLDVTRARRSRCEDGLKALHGLEHPHDVGDDGRVSVANMRRALT